MVQHALDIIAPPIHTEYRRAVSGMYSGTAKRAGRMDGGHNSLISVSKRADNPGTELPPPQISRASRAAYVFPKVSHVKPCQQITRLRAPHPGL